jgi:DNA-binding IclR family transcriptional regulator
MAAGPSNSPPGAERAADSVGDRTGAKGLVKGLALLRATAENPAGLGLAELSRATGVPKPTALRLLGPLLDYGLLRVTPDGRYRLGPECLVLGSIARESLDLREVARDLLRGLGDRTGETIHLGVRDGVRVVYIDKVESPHSLRMASRIGAGNPLYSTGLGKAILAFSGEEVVEAVIEAGLERRTAHTITAPGELRAELGRIRERGFAVDDVENEDGIRCVAAPVFDDEGEAVASISVTGAEYRLTHEHAVAIAPEVRAAALELSRRIGYRQEAGSA